jgi:isoleucyl-tRNA synthetase
VLKDRLYTYPVKFKPGREYQRELYLARRSAQTAIYKITDALARLTAPILSFTADEVWQSLPYTQGSVHLSLFPKPEELAPANASSLIADWDQILQVRNEVLAKLEGLRAQKVIGKSLEAVVTLSAKEYAGIPSLTKYAEALPELFNVSEVDFLTPDDNEPNALSPVSVDRSTRSKCDRCWRYTDDVGNEANFPTVCLRCAEALDAIDFPPYASTTSA